MKNNHLFDFQQFVEELRENEKKSEIINKFEEHYGSLQGKDLSEMPFYKDYLAKFEVDDELVQRLKVPDELIDEFDYRLLLILVAGSLSSNYSLEHCDDTDKERLKITVQSGDQSITKYLDDLWSFQIYRLFEIYVEEQMNMDILTSNSEEEKDAILEEREMRLKAFKVKMTILKLEIELAPKRLELFGKFHELIQNN